MDDPFFWGVDRVAHELSHLSEKFGELEVDGESLLTFQDILGSLGDMMRSLGIIKVPQQISFKKMIVSLQDRSAGYRSFREGRRGGKFDTDSAVSLMLETTPGLPSTEQGKSVQVAEGLETRGNHPHDCIKKKKVAPMRISQAPQSFGHFAILTEADRFDIDRFNVTQLETERATLERILSCACPNPGYLGKDGLNPREIMQTPSAEPDSPYEHFVFCRSATHRLPPARQLQVARAMIRQAGAVGYRVAYGVPDDDSDHEIGPYNPDEEWDPQTLLEIESDLKSDHEARICLSKKAIEAVIEKALKKMEDAWAENKRPKYERQAYMLWNDARRRNDRLTRLKSNQCQIGQFENRISKFKEGLFYHEWHTEAEVQRVTEILQPSVFDMLYSQWYCDLVSKPFAPPKPQVLPKPQAKEKKAAVRDEEDAESLSGSSDDADDFIENDEDEDDEEWDPMELDADMQPTEKATESEDASAGVLPEPVCSSANAISSSVHADNGFVRTPSVADLTLLDMEANEDGLDSDVECPASYKRRGRRVAEQKDAANLRSWNRAREAELDARRQRLLAELAKEGVSSQERARLIVNLSKDEDKALVYINDHVGAQAKVHQIEGIRFMWKQVVQDSTTRQGCLLAHTMGAGKTMQVITLLVTIAESVASADPAVSSQIPPHLRQSKTLVLCPSGLVNNWLDEFLKWLPDRGLLGRLRAIEAKMRPRQRLVALQEWVDDGGVLIVGYNMFSRLVESDVETAHFLHSTPTIIIADEAHSLKNSTSKIHQHTMGFHSMSRIAMTGSPLTNNVMDYYAMINWVAPNFLANISEFRSKYQTPIAKGLFLDSEPHEKRNALKRLQVLKATVAPKVDRVGIAELLKHLPPKKEFILTVPLTKLQKIVYERFVCAWNDVARKHGGSGITDIWSFASICATLLVHPSVFKDKLEMMQRPNKRKNAKENSDDDDELVSLPAEHINDLLALLGSRKLAAADVEQSYKMALFTEILDEAKRHGDKVLVFSQSLGTLNYLSKLLTIQQRNHLRLDGSTAIERRLADIKSFNNESSYEVFLISTKAGGVGLNIHGANRVVIFDFKYTPAEEQQAIGRAYRIGQRKPVFVYWLICGGTFERVVHNRTVFKTQLASRVVDKKNPVSWSKRLGDYLAMPFDPTQDDLTKDRGQDTILDALLDRPHLQGAIRQITSTDTFDEQEEEGTTLTDADRKEVDQEIRRDQLMREQKLRTRDLEQVNRGQSASLAIPTEELPTWTESDSPASPGRSLSNMMTKRCVPLLPSPEAHGPTSEQVADQASAAIATDAPQPSSVMVAPMLGLGTCSSLQRQPAAATAKDEGFLSGREAKLTNALEKVHACLQLHGRQTALSPEQAAQGIRHALESKPVIQYKTLFNVLIDLVEHEGRMAEAILADWFEGGEIADMQTKDLIAKSNELGAMDTIGFQNLVWNSQAEPRQSQTRVLARRGRAPRPRPMRTTDRTTWSATRPGDSFDEPHVIDD